ncbi:MAG: FemAB family PEP-CTERM system-associated protein [Cellvibrionaceae bacterium]|nr:FemAB family PEP-CTERM system-associated protein [Cellvibrionaceae bacterium]
MNDLSLPVDVKAWAGRLGPDALDQLQSINSRYTDMKQQLKRLNTDKGKLSRRIGEAKKNNTKDEQAIAEIKGISASIKQLNGEVSSLKSAVAAVLAETAASNVAPSLPGHFLTADSHAAESSASATVNIVQVDAAMLEAWNQYVDTHPRSCVYHRYEFREIIEQSFGHSCLYLAAYNQQRTICGILPVVQINSRIFGNYFVSIPMFNYAGPLADSEQIESQLIEHACTVVAQRGASHLELRDTKTRQNYQQKTSKFAMVRPLPQTAEQLWDEIGAKVRAQIKRADPHQLQFSSGGLELLSDFYRVFSINMRDLGTPVYGKEFFKNILEKTSLNHQIAVVYHCGKPVSCGFLFNYKGTMDIPWASTLRSANLLNANMFMYWNILKLSIDAKCQFFDFGRSTKDAGTFKFKKQWGAEPVPLFWHYWLKNGGELPELNPNNPKYRLVISAWQRFPIWLTKILGPPLVKNLP